MSDLPARFETAEERAERKGAAARAEKRDAKLRQQLARLVAMIETGTPDVALLSQAMLREFGGLSGFAKRIRKYIDNAEAAGSFGAAGVGYGMVSRIVMAGAANSADKYAELMKNIPTEDLLAIVDAAARQRMKGEQGEEDSSGGDGLGGDPQQPPVAADAE